MNIKKKLLACGITSIAVFSAVAPSILAAPKYNFNNYIGSGRKFTTYEMTKDNNGNTYYGQWRLRVKGSYANGRVITLEGDLREGHFSKGKQRAKEGAGSVWANNTAKAGARVHLSGRRVDMQAACTVWGEWSSDRT